MLAALLPHTATIQRKQALGTNGRSTLADLATGIKCLLTPMDHRTTVEHGFSVGLAYNITFDAGQDVKQADRVVIAGNNYTVRIVQPYTMPVVGYVQTMCEQEID